MKNTSHTHNHPLITKKLLILAIAAIPIYLYTGSLDGEWMMSWDDQVYVVENNLIKSVSWDNIYKIFTSFYFTDYHPLQHLSYMLDYSIWGLNPVGYRVTNLLLHTINGLMIFVLISSLLKQMSDVSHEDIPFIAGVASIIFLSHPTAVESVIWVSERKNVLSMAFMLSAFYIYTKYRETETKKLYYLSLIAFIFSLLSKASAVVFPLLIILYDYCLNRKGYRQTGKRVLLEKIPMLSFSLLSGVIALHIGSGCGSIKIYPDNNLLYQLFTTVRAVSYYIFYAFLPINLSALYHIPKATSPYDVRVLCSIILLISIFTSVYYSLKRSPIVFFCTGWFFISLLPVSGIVPLSNDMADRYLYIPIIGFAILLSLSIYMLSKIIAERFNSFRTAILIFLIPVCFIVIEFSRLTIIRTVIWYNEVTLWEDTLHKSPYIPHLYGMLGNVYLKKGLPSEALTTFSKGLKMVDGGSKEMRYDRGRAFFCLGNYTQAKQEFEKVATEYPDYAEVYYGLGMVYAQNGENKRALGSLERFIAMYHASKKAILYPRPLEDAKNWIKKIEKVAVDKES